MLLQNKMSLRLYQIILAALLMALTLVTKAIQHNPIGNDYLCFLIMLFLFPCVMQGSTENISFYRITIFFACGIVSAALTAQQIATFPNISQFITVDSYLTVTRLSGFYGDPNFYSAHISACLAGIQLLLCYEKGRRSQIVLAILALILLYWYRSYWKREPPAAAFACLWDSCVQELSLLLHQLSKHCFRLLMTVLLKHPTCLS